MFTLRFTDVMDTLYLLLKREWNQSMEEFRGSSLFDIRSCSGVYMMDGVEWYYLS